MSKEAKLELDGKSYTLPEVTGTEGEKAIDISSLRANTGYITLDEGYGNTGACVSKITFIDGDKGILRYRGIPIEDLADKSTFIETAFLIIYGHLPNRSELRHFSDLFSEHQFLHEDMKYHFESFPTGAHPMAILSAMINATSCFDDGLMHWQWGKANHQFDSSAAKLMSQVRTIAAYSYRKSQGLPLIYPKKSYKYTANFLHMMFSTPYEDFEIKPEVVKALDLIFLLHADHEQNCSTSTVRMVASSQANLFASAASGVCALWGPLHGGANQAVLEMLEEIHKTGDDGSKFIAEAKDKNSGKKLMGFGHRVYKNYDPRAKIISMTRYWTSRNIWSKLPCRIPILLSANCIPTWTFTAGSSCGRWASRCSCSRSCLRLAACPDGLPTTRRSWKTPRAALAGHARFMRAIPSANTSRWKNGNNWLSPSNRHECCLNWSARR